MWYEARVLSARGGWPISRCRNTFGSYRRCWSQNFTFVPSLYQLQWRSKELLRMAHTWFTYVHMCAINGNEASRQPCSLGGYWQPMSRCSMGKSTLAANFQPMKHMPKTWQLCPWRLPRFNMIQQVLSSLIAATAHPWDALVWQELSTRDVVGYIAVDFVSVRQEDGSYKHLRLQLLQCVSSAD